MPDTAALAYPMVRTAIDEAVRSGTSRGGMPSMFADFGAGSVARSLAGLKVAVQSWQRRVNAAPLLVMHCEEPGSDFGTLFDSVDRSADSYLGGTDGVYPLVAGRSPFQRAFPARSLAFGWTVSSLHRVSSAPAPTPDHVLVHLSADEAGTGGPPRAIGAGLAGVSGPPLRRDWRPAVRWSWSTGCAEMTV